MNKRLISTINACAKQIEVERAEKLASVLMPKKEITHLIESIRPGQVIEVIFLDGGLGGAGRLKKYHDRMAISMEWPSRQKGMYVFEYHSWPERTTSGRTFEFTAAIGWELCQNEIMEEMPGFIQSIKVLPYLK